MLTSDAITQIFKHENKYNGTDKPVVQLSHLKPVGKSNERFKCVR